MSEHPIVYCVLMLANRGRTDVDGEALARTIRRVIRRQGEVRPVRQAA
jgi:hypothetical protein